MKIITQAVPVIIIRKFKIEHTGNVAFPHIRLNIDGIIARHVVFTIRDQLGSIQPFDVTKDQERS